NHRERTNMTRPQQSLNIFYDTAPPTTATYTLSLHDALPIYPPAPQDQQAQPEQRDRPDRPGQRVRPEQQVRQALQVPPVDPVGRSEEHTSELQSRGHLVCRLLLENTNTSANTRPSMHIHPRL